MGLIFLRNRVSGAAPADAYAIGGNSPELVASFLTQEDGTTEGEYFRTGAATDDFTMFTFARSGSAWYFNSSGVLTEATSGNARRNAYYHNGTSWVKGGLQLESAAATNLVANSTPATAEMALTGVTITENALSSPLGASQAFLMTEDSATSEHRIQENTAISWVSGTKYCAWAIVKPNGRDWCYIRFISPVAGNNDRAYFNLTTGNVGSAGVNIDDYGMEPLGDGYYLVWATCVSGGTANRFWILGLANADNALSYLGDGTSGLYVAHLQVEANTSFPTSPIITNGSTATRAAETLSIAGADTPANTTAISISMKGLLTYADQNLSPQVEFFNQQTGNDFIRTDMRSDVGSGRVDFENRYFGLFDGVSSGTSDLSPGVNNAFNLGYRVTTSALNGALNGTSYTENTTLSGIVDHSASPMEIASLFTGFISEFRMWGADIGNTGIEEVTA
jgi:hypothetical protein